jgi:hypothetical protein
MSSIEPNTEPKYESVSQYNEDSEVAEILNDVVETISENTVEESTVFSAIEENETYSPKSSQSPIGPGSETGYENETTIVQREPELYSVPTIDTTDSVTTDSVTTDSVTTDSVTTDSVTTYNVTTDSVTTYNVLMDNVPNQSSQDYPLEPNSTNIILPREETPILQVSLLDLITNLVSDRELQKKYEFPIDAKYIDCLKQIVENHPKYFGSVESALYVIVKDGRISIADLPEIVQIVLDLYVILYSIHPKDLADMCAGILKTVFYIAVKGRVIVVEHENEIIWAFDSFIDSITELLKMNTKIHGTWNNITCGFSRLFRF